MPCQYEIPWSNNTVKVENRSEHPAMTHLAGERHMSGTCLAGILNFPLITSTGNEPPLLESEDKWVEQVF